MLSIVPPTAQQQQQQQAMARGAGGFLMKRGPSVYSLSQLAGTSETSLVSLPESGPAAFFGPTSCVSDLPGRPLPTFAFAGAGAGAPQRRRYTRINSSDALAIVPDMDVDSRWVLPCSLLAVCVGVLRKEEPIKAQGLVRSVAGSLHACCSPVAAVANPPCSALISWLLRMRSHVRPPVAAAAPKTLTSATCPRTVSLTPPVPCSPRPDAAPAALAQILSISALAPLSFTPCRAFAPCTIVLYTLCLVPTRAHAQPRQPRRPPAPGAGQRMGLSLRHLPVSFQAAMQHHHPRFRHHRRGHRPPGVGVGAARSGACGAVHTFHTCHTLQGLHAAGDGRDGAVG